MNKIDKQNIIDRCRSLRRNGISIGEISQSLNISKSTVYGYVKEILLDKGQKEKIEARRKLLVNSKPNIRKGKSLPGREIRQPKEWTKELVHVVAHYMFDGRIDDDGCLFYSKDEYQIDHMKELLGRVFSIKPKIQLRDNGVYGLVFYHVEFAKGIKRYRDELFRYLNNGASISEKRTFLKAFFDDEGNVFYKRDKRRVRGYQKSRLVLEEIKNLLHSFGIKGKINNKDTNIEISGQENLINFSKEINFSPLIYINPLRKNGLWKGKISKRKILDLALNSYQNRKNLEAAH